MAQLVRAAAGQSALQVQQKAGQRALLSAAEVQQAALEGLSRQDNELTGRHTDIARLLPGTASIPASCCAAQEPSGTAATRPPPFRLLRPCTSSPVFCVRVALTASRAAVVRSFQ